MFALKHIVLLYCLLCCSGGPCLGLGCHGFMPLVCDLSLTCYFVKHFINLCFQRYHINEVIISVGVCFCPEADSDIFAVNQTSSSRCQSFQYKIPLCHCPSTAAVQTHCPWKRQEETSLRAQSRFQGDKRKLHFLTFLWDEHLQLYPLNIHHSFESLHQYWLCTVKNDKIDWREKAFGPGGRPQMKDSFNVSTMQGGR